MYQKKILIYEKDDYVGYIKDDYVIFCYLFQY